MKPIQTARSNLIYTSADPGVRDLHAERVEPNLVRSVWRPTALEREQIASGANVELWIVGEPIPPVQLEVVYEEGTGEDDPVSARRLETLNRERLERAT